MTHNYVVEVTVANHFWAMKLLVTSDTAEHAKEYATAKMGPLLEQSGVAGASDTFVVGVPVALEDHVGGKQASTTSRLEDLPPDLRIREFPTPVAAEMA